jgi:hypothetical protein
MVHLVYVSLQSVCDLLSSVRNLLDNHSFPLGCLWPVIPRGLLLCLVLVPQFVDVVVGFSGQHL